MTRNILYVSALAISILGLSELAFGQNTAPLHPDIGKTDEDPEISKQVAPRRAPEALKPRLYNSFATQSPTTAFSHQTGWPLHSDGLLGNMFGARSALEEQGIFLNGGVATIFGWNTTGGLATDLYGGNLLSIGLTLDTKSMFDIDGGTLFADYQQWTSFGGPFGRTESMDATGAWDTSIDPLPDTPTLNQVSQLWYDQKFGDTGLSIRFGKQDANLLFSTINGSASFMNSTAGMPSTLNPFFPTYPEPAMGLVASWEIDNTILGRFGWFDGSNGAFDPATGGYLDSTGSRGPGTFFDNKGHWFFITEWKYQWMLDQERPGSIAAAGWLQTGKTGTNGRATNGVHDVLGWYLYGSQTIWSPSAEISRQGGGIIAFGQISGSDPDKNPADWAFMAGISATGVLPTRDGDSVGFVVGYTDFSDNPDVYLSPATSQTNGNPGGSETFMEAYYAYEVTPWLQIQPGIQWFSTPGGGDPASLSDALMFYLRIASEF